MSDIMQFEKFNLNKDILKALDKLNYKEALPVQEGVIPIILAGGDVIVKSKTGSGKTASFAIPIIEKIEWDCRYPQALILSPTRELALQIKGDFDSIGAYKRIKSTVLYGKTPYKEQIDDLKQRMHIVVGTPGRVLDHLNRGTLIVEMIKYVVIDEADEMLNMGFIESVSEIISMLNKQKQMCLCSATMPQAVVDLASRFLKNPQTVEMSASNDIATFVEHYAYKVLEHQKKAFLVKLLCEQQVDSCIVFAKTQEHVDDICDYLFDQGIDSDKIHGGMLQKDRIMNMNDFREGKLRILVATDVAARGIDIKDISHIINYDLPELKENYVHRLGRSGRLDTKGKAISFISEFDDYRLKELEEFLGYSIPQKNRLIIDEIEVDYGKLDTLGKRDTLKEDKHQNIKQDIFKIFMNGGKSKKIRASDIVGAICEIEGIKAEDIGVIQVQELQSYVDILNNKGTIVLNALQTKTIKGKQLKVQRAKTK